VAGSFDRTVQHLQELVAVRARLDLRLRMNFTVMRRTVAELPRMMRFAQELGVPLYLNLATDHTFLFRDGQVSLEARVTDEQVDAALAEVEQVLRHDARFLPRPAELQYLRRHFDDVVQRSLPCAESQLKLMVRSRGEVGGCWAHGGTANVRTTRLADLLASPEHRQQGDRLFRKECVGCGSNYALNLRWRPGSYVQDARWRAGRATLARPA
jgi:MoaA/NifB/PqqE/SkfB family radical SAM enzyme